MPKLNIIAIDLGATSGRVMLATLTANSLSMEELHRFNNPIHRLFGRYYWNIFSLFEHIQQGLRMAAQRGITIDSIGVDTWGVDFVLIGTDGSPLSLPRAYRDPYTNNAPAAFFEEIPARQVYNRTGTQIMPFNTLYQLFAAKREGNSPLEAAGKLLLMPDAITYMLTGKMVCEQTILSTTQCADPRTKTICDELLEVAGVDLELFAPIVAPGTFVAPLSKEIAEATGLGDVRVIAVAGHDTASAVAAVPATTAGFAYLSSGTWSLMGIELEQPIINDESYTLNFTNEGGIEGTTRFLKNITGMWLLEQCRAIWSAAGKNYSYTELVEMSQSAEPFAALIDPDHSSFASPVNMIEAICNYCRETGQNAPATDASLVRTIFESLALKYRVVLDKLRNFAPVPIEVLHVIGGGAQNKLLNQMTANAVGLTVVAGPVEATAIGNVMVQAAALGFVSDRKSMRAFIANSIETQRFEPEESELWEIAYKSFLTIIK